MTDFITEYIGEDEAHKSSDKSEWIIYMDGSSTQEESRAGLMLERPHDAKIYHALKFGFNASNNEVENEALIIGLKLAKDVGANHLKIFSNSILIVQQVKGKYKATGEGMTK